MSLADPAIFYTEYDDGSADFTISIDGEDHKFSAVNDEDVARLSYEETLSWRMELRVKEPREEVWKLLMQSEQMTDYLELNNLSSVRRE